MQYLMNVDKPESLCTIHRNNCGHALITETPLKGIEELREDGGWYAFTSIEQAEEAHKTRFPQYNIKKCGKCLKISG